MRITRSGWATMAVVVICTWSGYAAAPVVSGVNAIQRAGTKLVDITYNVSDVDSTQLTVSVSISTNNGGIYDLPATHFSGGGYGSGVTPGTGKQIVWDAGADWDGKYSTQVWFKVVADQPEQSLSVSIDPTGGVFYYGHNYMCWAVVTGGSPPYSYLWTYSNGPSSTNNPFSTILTTVGFKWTKVAVTDAHGAFAVSGTNFFNVILGGGSGEQ